MKMKIKQWFSQVLGMGKQGRDERSEMGNGLRPEEMSLLLASHGTPLHKGSRVAADGLAEELKKDGYQVSRAMFLEEEPKIADWRQVAAMEGPVMVLPHFLAGGLHGSEDVPRLLGIPSGKEGWYQVDGRWIGYGAPIGTPAEMTELILKMVAAEI